MHERKVLGEIARLIGREDIATASKFLLIESPLSKATFITVA